MRIVVYSFGPNVVLRSFPDFSPPYRANRYTPHSSHWFRSDISHSSIGCLECFSIKIFDKSVFDLGFDFIAIDGGACPSIASSCLSNGGRIERNVSSIGNFSRYPSLVRS